jgi:hypothetical protein
MKDPRYRVERRTNTPPDAVLAAIQQAAAAAKRGDLPGPLQRGNRGLRGVVRGNRFVLWFDVGDSDQTELRGTVVPAPDGGSEVRASAEDGRNEGIILVLLVGYAVVALIAGGGIAWWALGVAAAIGLAAAVRRGMGIINHAQAAYHLEWLNGVLDRAEASGAVPPAHDPARPGIPA